MLKPVAARLLYNTTRGLRATQALHWQNFENERHYEPGEDVLKRTWHGLTYDFRRWRRRFNEARRDAFQRRNPIAHMKHSVLDQELFPFRSEILIIGGGITGSSTAYWLKQRFRDEDLKVVVVEDNDTFATGSTLLSSGGISQQFSLHEHIEMSLFTTEFLRHAGEHLKILDNESPDIHLFPCGYLHLATTEEEAEQLRNNWKTLIEKGAHVSLHTAEELKEMYPQMNFDDVIVGCMGNDNEGSIDTWQLLSAIREKNITLGVQYVKGTVEGFEFERLRPKSEVHSTVDPELADDEKWRGQRIVGVNVRPQMTDASARLIRSNLIVNAAGPWAGKVAEMAGIGKGNGLLAVPVPVKPRKRTNFLVHAPDVQDIPFIMDPSGVYCRQTDAGNLYLVGKNLSREEDDKTDHSNLDVDYGLYENVILPTLVKRIPGFSTSQIKSAWSHYEGVNVFDEAPIIGEHPLYGNLFMMCGFGNRDVMHSLAAGRAFAERVFDGAYVNINLRRFDMRRIVKMDRLKESFSC